MPQSGLAQELLPELKAIAKIHNYRKVYYIEMIVGRMHHVTADALEADLSLAFAGTPFSGADLEIRIVNAGETYRSRNSAEDVTANGFEVLVVRMTGDE